MRYILTAFSLFLLINETISQSDCDKSRRDGNRISESHKYAYSADFYMWRCRCLEKGMPSEEASKQALAAMQIDKDNYVEFGGSASDLDQIPPSCKITSSDGGDNAESGNANSIDPNKGRVLNDETMAFLNILSSNSENEDFNTMIREMNQNSQNIAKGRQFAETFGTVNQTDYEMYNMIENLGQAIAFGKFLSKIFGSNSKEPELTPDQLAVQKKIGEISKYLRSIYNETNAIPTYFEYNEQTLQAIDDAELNIINYERVTAKQRLLFWEYQAFNGYPGSNDIRSIIDKIDLDYNEYGMPYLLSRIAQLSSKFSNATDFPHFVNSNFGFAGANNRISLYRYKCYMELGEPDLAERELSKINKNVSINDAIKLMQEAYEAKNYFQTITYYNIIRDYFTEHRELKVVDFNLINLSLDIESLYRSDVNFLLALGVFAAVKSNQLSQAQEAFTFLQNYQNEFENGFERFQAGKIDFPESSPTDIVSELQKGKCFVEAAKAVLLQKRGDNQNALKAIDLSIHLESEHFHSSFIQFKPWLLFTKAEIQVNLGDYDHAIMEAKELTRVSTGSFTKAFNKTDLRYLIAYCRYKNSDLKGALIGIQMLKKRNPENAKFSALEADIYESMGETDQASLSKKEYEKKIQLK